MQYALLSRVSRITDAFLERVRDAYLIRGAQTAASWSPVYPSIVAPTVRIVSSVSEFTDADVPALFVGSFDPKDAGDLAFHFIQPDAHGVQRPYMMILADAYQPLPSVEKAFGHEGDETLVDPTCALYDPSGWAIEVADPVQEDTRAVDIGRGDPVAFSAIALPAWFGLGTGPIDTAGLLTTPHTVHSGGYAMMQDGTEVHGDGFKHAACKSCRHCRRMKRRHAIDRLITLR